MEDYSDDLAILLDELQLEQVYLNAHSMGASIATMFLNRHSDRVKQAILPVTAFLNMMLKLLQPFINLVVM